MRWREVSRRGLFGVLHAAAGLSLALGIATAVASAWGGWVDIQPHRLVGNWYYSADGGSQGGIVQIALVHFWDTPVVGPPIGTTGAALDAFLNQPPNFRFQSGEFRLEYWGVVGSNGGANSVMFGRELGVSAPFGGAIAILLILPAFTWVFLALRRRGIRSIKPKPDEMIESWVITNDLICVQCGYNLRTRSSMGRCPECGSPVSDSCAINGNLTNSRPAWLRRVMAGNALLFLSRLFLAATFAAVYQRNGGFVAEYAAAVGLAGGTLLLYGAGIFLVTAREYPHVPPASRKRGVRLRKVAAVSLICLSAGGCYQVIETITAPRPMGLMGLASVHWYWTSLILLLIGWVVYCSCVVAEFMFLAKLAERLGDHLMAKLSLRAGIGAAASSVLLLYGTESIVQQSNTLGMFSAIVVVLWFLFLGWTALLNVDFAVRLRKKAAMNKTVKSAFLQATL